MKINYIYFHFISFLFFFPYIIYLLLFLTNSKRIRIRTFICHILANFSIFAQKPGCIRATNCNFFYYTTTIQCYLYESLFTNCKLKFHFFITRSLSSIFHAQLGLRHSSLLHLLYSCNLLAVVVDFSLWLLSWAWSAWWHGEVEIGMAAWRCGDRRGSAVEVEIGEVGLGGFQ